MKEVRHYSVLIHSAAEGGFWSEVPALPACFSQGETVEEIKRRSYASMECHLQAMRNMGLTPPLEVVGKEGPNLPPPKQPGPEIPSLDTGEAIRRFKAAGLVELYRDREHMTLVQPETGAWATLPITGEVVKRAILAQFAP